MWKIGGRKKQVKLPKYPSILYANLIFTITMSNFMPRLQKKIEYLLKLYKITCPFLGKGGKKRSGCMKALFYVQSELQLHKLTKSYFLSPSK